MATRIGMSESGFWDLTTFEFGERVDAYVEAERLETDRARMAAYATAGLSRSKRMPNFSLWMRSGDSAMVEQDRIEEGKEIFDQIKAEGV